MSEWEYIGSADVDSGTLWLGDPCYLIGHDRPFDTWDDFLRDLQLGAPTISEFNHANGNSGMGLCVSAGFGDGTYDIYAKLVDVPNWGRRVKEVKVVFIEDDEIE